MGIGLASGWEKVLFPIISSEYWFITVYLVLYCLTPYIKIFVQNISKSMHLSLLVVLFVLQSVIPTVFNNEGWLNSGGAYGIVWFVFLYLIGAYLRLYSDTCKISKRMKIIIFWGTIMVGPIYKFIVNSFEGIHWRVKEYENAFYYANSMFTLVATVMLFLLFEEIEINGKMCSKFINYLGQGCLGVYLIHNNRNIAHYLWEKLRINYWLVERENIIIILIICLIVFLLCNLLEHIRMNIFRIIKVDSLIVKISSRIENTYQRWSD